MLKSKVSTPTRYSLKPGTSTPVAERTPPNLRESTASRVDFDLYMSNLKNRYMSAVES